MEENAQKIGRNSLGEGHYEFITPNGEKVEIKLVNWLNMMNYSGPLGGPYRYEQYMAHSAGDSPRQLDCYDVTITKYGNSTTKRCYLHLTYPRLELSNALKDEEFAEMIESTFSPERLEEREQEAKEHDSTYLYLGGIGRKGSNYLYVGEKGRDSNGELYRYRVFPEDSKRLSGIYESMRADERMETEYIAYYADPEVVKQLGQHYSQEEITKALQRLDKMKETDLVNEIQSTREKLEELEAQLKEHREKINQGKINPEISPAFAQDISDVIADTTRQIHDDLTVGKDEPTIEE